MRTNAAGLELIKAHEGLRLEAYRDPAGIWTIGYGHTSAAGEPKVTPGLKITEFDAENILARDLAIYETAVESAVTVPLNRNQFSALVSFCFNVGPGAFRDSSVLRVLNEGHYNQVPARLALWNKATVNGKKVELKGLTKRRKAEGKLFMAPDAAEKAGGGRSWDRVADTGEDRPGAPQTLQGGWVGKLIGALIAAGIAAAAYFGLR